MQAGCKVASQVHCSNKSIFIAWFSHVLFTTVFSAAHVNMIGSFLHLAYIICLCPHHADFGCVGGGSMLL